MSKDQKICFYCKRVGVSSFHIKQFGAGGVTQWVCNARQACKQRRDQK